MSYQCEIKAQPDQPVLSIRTRSAVENLPNVLGQAYGEIMQHLGELGEYPAGEPFAAYYNMDMQDLDIEIGFPVAKSLPGKGDVQAGKIPAWKKAYTIHTGPYEACEPAYEALTQYVADNGYEATGVAYEFYLSGPETPPAEIKTRIMFPLKDK